MIFSALSKRLIASRTFLIDLSSFKKSFPICGSVIRNYSIAGVEQQKYDKLYKEIGLEIRGHDPAVLNSYTTFVQNVCNLLEIEGSRVTVHPYKRWLLWANRSKFARKKYKFHYETRTHIRDMRVYNLTGSTALTFLEYIERNIPEGVAMHVTYREICPLPDMITNRSVC